MRARTITLAHSKEKFTAHWQAQSVNSRSVHQRLAAALPWRAIAPCHASCKFPVILWHIGDAPRPAPSFSISPPYPLSPCRSFRPMPGGYVPTTRRLTPEGITINHRFPPVPASDPKTCIHRDRTACLPWMTGTAVNPLLRAVYLARRKEKHHVTLLVPWIEPSEQHHIFSKGVVYERKEQLEAYIRDWVRINLGFVTKIKIAWWDGVYLIPYGSILPKGDPIESIPPGERDVAVLEEPEHLTWCVSLSVAHFSFAAC